MDPFNINGGDHPNSFGCMGTEAPDEKDFGTPEPCGGTIDVELGPIDVKLGPGQDGITKDKFLIEK